MGAKWTRAISMALVLALTGAAYGHCVSAPGHSAAAAHAMPPEDLSQNGMAMPDDCDGCDRTQPGGDACLSACANTVALPTAREVGLVAAASQAMPGAAQMVLAGIHHPPDPHPPNVTASI